MDWSKTKTIFIVVFAILNLFLYSLYVSQYREAQNMQVFGEMSINESLKMENITVAELPEYPKELSYISADIAKYSANDLETFKGQKFSIPDDTTLYGLFEEPFNVKNEKGEYQFDKFLEEYVPYGEDYGLWQIVEENQFALFFQEVNHFPIYFNNNGMLIVYWDEDGNITKYEQQRLTGFEYFNKKKDILSPEDVMNILYSRDYLPRDSTITSMLLGYSSLITLTKTQVFAPTWRIRVELKDGGYAEHFVNAIEGKIVDFQMEERNQGDS